MRARELERSNRLALSKQTSAGPPIKGRETKTIPTSLSRPAARRHFSTRPTIVRTLTVEMGEPDRGRGQSTVYGAAQDTSVPTQSYQQHSADSKGDAAEQAAGGDDRGNSEIWYPHHAPCTMHHAPCTTLTPRRELATLSPPDLKIIVWQRANLEPMPHAPHLTPHTPHPTPNAQRGTLANRRTVVSYAWQALMLLRPKNLKTFLREFFGFDSNITGRYVSMSCRTTCHRSQLGNASRPHPINPAPLRSTSPPPHPSEAASNAFWCFTCRSQL